MIVRNDDVQMLSDKEYRTIARKILYAHCIKSLAISIHKDPVAFGLLVNAIMSADWEFNGTGTIHGYRKRRGLWMIYKIIKNRARDREKAVLFSDITEFNHSVKYKGTTEDPTTSVDDQDYIEYVEKKIGESELLSQRQKWVVISRLLKQKTDREISEEFGISISSVRGMLTRAYKKIGSSLCVS
jgi:DNA-binding CsgD family transcriptional regulator